MANNDRTKHVRTYYIVLKVAAFEVSRLACYGFPWTDRVSKASVNNEEVRGVCEYAWPMSVSRTKRQLVLNQA